MKHKVLLIFFLLTSFCLYASNVKFYSVNSLYGISMREVASVCKDKNGFVWASSKMGILRMTGNDYRIYHLPYESADIISVKIIYTNSELLAFTNNGQLFRYNALRDRFDCVVNMSKVLNNRYISVSNVVIDENGGYWIASSFGLYRYFQGHFTFIGKRSQENYYITSYGNNQLIVASRDGIWLLDTHLFKRKWLYKTKFTSTFEVSKLFYDQKTNALWIGTMSEGLFIYRIKERTISTVSVPSFPKQPILAIESNSDSTVLVGIDGQGIWELNKQGNKVFNIYKEEIDNPSSLKGNGVYDIFSDQNSRIWVSTYSGGVSFFDQSSQQVDHITHKINSANSLANNNVNKIVQDKRGNIWFATDNGISCLDVKTGGWRTFYQNKQEQSHVFLSLCVDNKDRIWAGTYSSGVYVLDGNSGRELAHYSRETANSPIDSKYVLEIYKDSQGDIWIGGVRSKVIRYVSKEDRFQNYSSQPVVAFAELSPDKMLLACTYGLCLLDKRTGNVQTLLGGYLVHDVLIKGQEAWVCTSGEGLIRYNLKTRKADVITTESGLSSNYVNSIMYANGYIWVGTELGLCRLNPANLGIQTYNSEFPLSKVSFNRNSHCALLNGQLIWGTSNGAVCFDPKVVQEVQQKGSIFFQNISLAGRTIRESLDVPMDSLNELSLSYRQNTLNIELLSIGPVVGAKFSWKLEGLDNDWSEPSGNSFVNYSNIPNGDYVLKIRLYDNSLSHVISERTLLVSVVPPFWETWWFRLLLFIILMGLGYLLLDYYVKRLKEQHMEEKVRFFTNTAHDMRTSLTLIKAPIEELASEMHLSDLGRHYLSLATEQARRLSAVVTQLMDFQKMDIGKEQLALGMVDIIGLVEHRKSMFESFAKGKNIELLFTADQEYYQTAIDESMMEKVVDNLISNAIKYSHPDSQVLIDLKCSPDNWILEVKDRGIGISKKAQRQLFKEFYRGENAINSKIVGSGIGLLLVKNYVGMHGGEITCESQENVGSAFRIIIPFKEIAEEEANIVKDDAKDSSTHVIVDVNSPVTDSQDVVASASEMRILIVEDNDDLRNFMRYPLMSDFEVLLAQDGVEAWDIIQKQMPDLVVSDVMMPNMDGFELCRLMKSTYETSHIPVILLTALSANADQLHGLGLGADDYLTKPFDMNLLVQRIKSIIRNRQAVKEKALKLIKVVDKSSDQILSNELNDRFVKKMLEVVKSNMANTEFGKDDFAAAMNVSASLLYKKVKSLTDQSPTDFIKTVRLDYALELLQSQKYSVTEVSELCGFSTIGYFSTVFKKHFGKSPTEI